MDGSRLLEDGKNGRYVKKAKNLV
ncbi:hypothetical protein QTG54_009181 [Skeletonema marinoi]|uniref:Uncharacterized protein n=1 Tax=Skeletonema marinoi TaxID=267567 RepID=A0AAD9DAF3_9STRA|nr:hypothetical protein QTG54_009181 [Skeletonema marinoi]